jgi:hypothetical protein
MGENDGFWLEIQILRKFGPMNPAFGKYLIGIGLLIVVIGVIIYFFSDKLHWLGQLPGDIRIKREKFGFYFPIVTCIVLSVVLNLIIWLVRRFL